MLEDGLEANTVKLSDKYSGEIHAFTSPFHNTYNQSHKNKK